MIRPARVGYIICAAGGGEHWQSSLVSWSAISRCMSHVHGGPAAACCTFAGTKRVAGTALGDSNLKWPSWLSFDRPRPRCLLWRLGRLLATSSELPMPSAVSVEGWRRRLRPRFLVSRWFRSFQLCRPAGDGLEEQAPTTAGEPGSPPCRVLLRGRSPSAHHKKEICSSVGALPIRRWARSHQADTREA